MADDLERAWSRTRRNSVVIHREDVLQSLTRHKVLEALARIWHARNSEQMTLLADAIAAGRLELCRIDDCSRVRIGEMLFDRAVAPFTSDRFGCKRR